VYNILVVGAGYVGKAIIKAYAEKKQRVYGLVKSEDSAEAIESLGGIAMVADLQKSETLKKIPPAHFIVVCPAPEERTENAYRCIYVDGVGHFLRAIQNNPRPYLILYTSSTRVWGHSGPQWLDENVEAVARDEKAEILLEAEKQILECGYPSLVLRLAGIYGPNRLPLDRIKKQVPMVSERDSPWTNRIHIDDLANICITAMEHAEDGEIFNVGTENRPVGEIAEKAGCSSATARKHLGNECATNDLFKQYDGSSRGPTTYWYEYLG